VATIERFEQIEAWQEARKLTNTLYELTSEGKFARDFGLRDQIRRAAVSVMSNIAEGFQRGGDQGIHPASIIGEGLRRRNSVTALCCF
jgi:hypothetical protein